MRNELCTVADAQDGNPAHKLTEVHLECLWVVNRIGRTAQNHTNHRGVVLRELVVGQNLAESIQLTDTTADKLRGL